MTSNPPHTDNLPGAHQTLPFRALYPQQTHNQELDTYVETQVRRMPNLPIPPDEVIQRLRGTAQRGLTVGFTLSVTQSLVAPAPANSATMVDAADQDPPVCQPGNCTGVNCMVLVDLLQSMALRDNNDGYIHGQGGIISDCFNSIGAPSSASPPEADVATARRAREPSEELVEYDEGPETSAQGAARSQGRYIHFYDSEYDSDSEGEGYSPVESADDVEEAELLRIREDPTTTLVVGSHTCTTLNARIKTHNNLLPTVNDPVTTSQKAIKAAFNAVSEAIVLLARSQVCTPGAQGTARFDDIHAIYGSLLKTAMELSVDAAAVKGSTHAMLAAKLFAEALQYPIEILPFAAQSNSSATGSRSKRPASEMAESNPESNGLETMARGFKLPRTRSM